MTQSCVTSRHQSLIPWLLFSSAWTSTHCMFVLAFSKDSSGPLCRILELSFCAASSFLKHCATTFQILSLLRIRPPSPQVIKSTVLCWNHLPASSWNVSSWTKPRWLWLHYSMSVKEIFHKFCSFFYTLTVGKLLITARGSYFFNEPVSFSF